MSPRLLIKRFAQGIALLVTLPMALLCGFGRWEIGYTIFAHAVALAPGILGNFLRGAFYKMTLEECSIDTNIAFGTYFVYRQARVGPQVSIGSYCVIARVSIGEGTQIASLVQVPGGRHQHARNPDGTFSDIALGMTSIGTHCWIGASAVVMASIGDRTTVGAGAIVTHDLPAGVVAVGNPARVISAASEAAASEAMGATDRGRVG